MRASNRGRLIDRLLCRDLSVTFRSLKTTAKHEILCGLKKGGHAVATAREALERSSIYRFGDREVDIRLRQVRAAGTLVDAQPKAFDLLVYLIENRDRVVDKDELLAQLWSGTVVTDSALNQVVRKARSLAGDDGERQAVIRTVQRRGFRFVAVLQARNGESTAGRAQANAVAPSVAVLPFADMSPERDQEYFCDGMVEEIITELSRIPWLHVAARTSSFAFKHRADDVREIGRQLGVNSVLEGSVRKAGDKLRVTAQLIDAATGFHLWSERWDRKLEDMLAIQGEIGLSIAAVLRRSRAAAGSPATITFRADDLCERGFAHLNRTSRRSQRFALDLFQQALSIDPESVRAWAGSALSHVVLYRTTTSTKRHLTEAMNAATRAMQLGPRSAIAWTAYGAATAIDAGFADAERAFARAIELDPGLFEAHHYFGHTCIEAGHYELAAEQFEAAAAARPDDYQALVFARQAYRSLGRSADELSAAARQIAAAERALRKDPTDARALSLSTGSLVALGRVEEARAWTRRSRELEPDEPYVQYNAACVLAQLGQVEEALTALESGTEYGRLCRPSWVEHDEDLASLRGNPRFEALLNKMRVDDPARPRQARRRREPTAPAN
jgi:TolB-like protein/Flp pilus assembly protein TadD